MFQKCFKKPAFENNEINNLTGRRNAQCSNMDNKSETIHSSDTSMSKYSQESTY